MTERKAELLLALTTIFWSGTFVFTKLALDDCNPLLFVTLRFVVATLAAVIIWRGAIPTISRAVVRDGVILGLLYGGGFVLQTWGLLYTTISKSAFITGLTVIFIPAADWFIRKRSVSLFHAIAVLIAGSGMLLFTQPERSEVNCGDMMTLIGSMLWASYISFLDKTTTRNVAVPFISENLVITQFASTVGLCSVVYMVISTTGVDVSALTLSDHTTRFTAMLWISILYTALIGSLVSTFQQTRYQRFVAPVKAGIIFTLEPIFAAAIAYFTHDERMTLTEMGGALLMIGAIVFADAAPIVVQRLRRIKS